jgi:hypothetical protein
MMKNMNDVIECTGRPGILKFKRDGAMHASIFRDAEHTKPYVCQCECEARKHYSEVIATLIQNSLIAAFNGIPVEQFVADGKLYQDPDSFYYVYVDEEPAELDASAETFQGEAQAIIDQVKSS